MAAIISFVIFFPLISLVSLASGLPNVTAIQIGQNDCSAFPNSYFHAGDNADAFVFHPDQAENSSINGLQTGISGTNLVVYENNTVTGAIFCCDRGGTILDGFGMQTLLLSTNLTSEELGYLDEGIKPQIYVHDVDGVRQDGVFLGMANVTTWAFKRAAANLDYYQIRLLVPGSGDPKEENLDDGEFKGFLKVTAP